MDAIIKNITELFYQHDCIVVPRLGGFIANYRPAFFDSETNLVIPPRKEFIFNRFLLHNDGLLAHHLSADLGISYNESVVLIDRFVDGLFNELKSKNSCSIDLIGTLYYDQSQHLRLKTHNQNYLLSSFGLPIVKSLPKIHISVEDTTPVISITKETIHAVNEVAEEANDNKVIAITRNQKSSTAKWWIAAAVLPIAFYSAWIPMKTDLFKKDGHFHYSDLNPFVFEKPVGVYAPINGFAMRIDSLQYTFSSSEFDKTIEVNNADTLIYVDHSNLNENVAEVVKASNKGEYHLIGGCFSNEENANKFVADMQSKGLSAQIIDQTGGLYRVSVANCASGEEATVQKSQLETDLNIPTWILKKAQK